MSLIVNPARPTTVPRIPLPTRPLVVTQFAEDAIEHALKCLNFDQEIASHSIWGECSFVIHNPTNTGYEVIR